MYLILLIIIAIIIIIIIILTLALIKHIDLCIWWSFFYDFVNMK